MCNKENTTGEKVSCDSGKTRTGMLIVVSGPSGAGKGTILKKVLEQRSDCVNSISATTRNPRPGEVDGVNYFFLDLHTFNKWIENNQFIEWNQHFSAYYGTPKEFVDQQRAQGKHVILEIDVTGGLDVMKKMEDCVTIFLCPPSWEILEQRLRNRGTENAEEIASRLLVARTEVKNMEKYSYTVINEDIDEAVANFNAIVDAEMNKTNRLFEDGLLSF